MLKPSLTLFSLLLATAAALPAGISSSLGSQHAGHLATRGGCTTRAEQVQGTSSDTNGRGVQVKNADSQSRSFFVYANSCDYVPLKYVTLGAGQSAFVSLPQAFQGRIVRGTTQVNLDGRPHLLGTWLEIGLDGDGSGKGWADVSLIRGCDGAVSVAAADGTGASTGFQDSSILDDAPGDALEAKDSGSKVIKATEGLLSVVVEAARDYLASKLGYDKAYIDDYHGNPVICSSNERFSATFYRGRP
ncbi:hypothetical protein F4820DRAFT_412933 [Hypoxylon rubiginosum]|uniref:Uncharacterized protein n=1 Tax=Hypoxylon rubiginosum TaxID=110542 RepID=A0ACB9Z8A3_9PEZI|nr:hypothetical protein F4820DRAFT_412933 [Hypoxylon rubiginosum]